MNHQSYHNKTPHSTCETSSTIEQSTKFLMNYLNYHKLRYKNVSTCCHSSIYFVNLVQAKGYCFCYKKIVSLNNLHSLIIRIKTLTYRLSLNFEHGNSEVRNTSEESSKTMNCSENQPVINLFASIKLNNIT